MGRAKEKKPGTEKVLVGTRLMLFPFFHCRCNGHPQGAIGVGPNVGSVLRANGECRGAGRKMEGVGPDLFSEINLPEMQ